MSRSVDNRLYPTQTRNNGYNNTKHSEVVRSRIHNLEELNPLQQQPSPNHQRHSNSSIDSPSGSRLSSGRTTPRYALKSDLMDESAYKPLKYVTTAKVAANTNYDMSSPLNQQPRRQVVSQTPTPSPSSPVKVGGKDTPSSKITSPPPPGSSTSDRPGNRASFRQTYSSKPLPPTSASNPSNKWIQQSLSNQQRLTLPDGSRIVPIKIHQGGESDSNYRSTGMVKDKTYQKLNTTGAQPEIRSNKSISNSTAYKQEYQIPVLTEDDYKNANDAFFNNSGDSRLMSKSFNSPSHVTTSHHMAATKIQALWRGHAVRNSPVITRKLQSLWMKRVEGHVQNIYEQLKSQEEDRKIQKNMHETQIQLLKLIWDEVKGLKHQFDGIRQGITQISQTKFTSQPMRDSVPVLESNSPASPNKIYNTSVDADKLPRTEKHPTSILSPAKLDSSHQKGKKMDDNGLGNNLTHTMVDGGTIVSPNTKTDSHAATTKHPQVIKCSISDGEKSHPTTTSSQPFTVQAASLAPKLVKSPEFMKMTENTGKNGLPEEISYPISSTVRAEPDLSDDFMADLDELENKIKCYETLKPAERNFLLSDVSSTIMALQENLAKCLLNEAESTSKELRNNNDFIDKTTSNLLSSQGDGNAPKNFDKDAKVKSKDGNEKSDVKLLASFDANNNEISGKNRIISDEGNTRSRGFLRSRDKTKSLDNTSIIESALDDVLPNEYPIKYPKIFEYLTQRDTKSTTAHNHSVSNPGSPNRDSIRIKNGEKTFVDGGMPHPRPATENDLQDETKVVDDITEDIVNSILLKAVKKYNDNKSHRSLSARANRFFDIDLTKL